MTERAESYSDYKPGVLEKWGIKILRNYVNGDKEGEKLLGPSPDFFPKSTRIIRWASFLGLQIGFWTTYFIILVEKLFPESPETFSPEFIEKWSYAGAALAIGTILEFYLLYKLGLWAAYKLTKLSGIELEEDPDLVTGNANLLSRMALEIPDPDLKLLGIDPLRLTDKRSLLIRTFFYKTKVLLSNLIAKIVLRKILARNSLRVYADYIAAPITAIWDGVVMYLILKELRIRLLSRIIAKEVTDEILKNKDKLSKEGKIAFLAAVGNSVVFTQIFHPNLEYMLIKMHKGFGSNSQNGSLDDLDTFGSLVSQLSKEEKKACLRLLCVACSFDGKLSAFETKHIKRILGEEAKENLDSIRILSEYIRKGNLEACRERSRLFS
ncbi:hypothetical protein EHQ81_12980 [Leptospira selangorensis]|uniref:Uncharacterized protein n=1 Tax=Leptospira selangorensis TaxID=2484982 RepID=A0A5F2C829_9LEPT|nr:hypothetical protein [Leptospira selangorensis]TGM12794.1 hypothetical protein EHQ81_12980 [Leptospira selangorensis]TGM30855.1 hypothetical protein EHQ82_00820 [Leptospira selangorensis]